MKNKHYQVVISEDDMMNVLYHRKDIDHITVDNKDWIEKFNQHCVEFNLSTVENWEIENNGSSEEFIEENLNDWNLPSQYSEFDLESFLLEKCNTDIEVNRVRVELAEFKKRNMIIILKWLKYFVDTMRENNLIWGAGRGSSTASYVLFLLDVHRVDSLKYDLSLNEFLK